MHEHGVRSRRRGSTAAARRAGSEQPRPTRVGAPNVRTRTFAGRSCRPTESQSTSTYSNRAASSRDDVDRLREHGVVGVDLLGDEEEAHSEGRAGDGRVDELTQLAGELLGRRVPVRVARVRRRAQPLRQLAVAEHAHERRGERGGVGGRDEQALDLVA